MTEEGKVDFINIDFGVVKDTTHGIIKVVGVGGGGCNAVSNMYDEGLEDVSFAVCNTDSKSLSASKVPVKVQMGKGWGAGGKPEVGRAEAEQSIDQLRQMLDDGTQMVFITAGMGGGTGTGAAPVVAGLAKEMGLLTIGVVSIPFYFEKSRKIIRALRGVEEMRKNVDALLIINNERICKVYGGSEVSVFDSFKEADNILKKAVKSIAELITMHGTIQLDFRDVEATMREGGGAIMAVGRASGDKRVQKAFSDALDSPLLFGRDITRAKRILFNIYTSSSRPALVNEMFEIDDFMDSVDENVELIWGIATDDSLGDDVKVTILATGMDDDLYTATGALNGTTGNEEEDYKEMIRRLYIDDKLENDQKKPDVPPVVEELPADEPSAASDTPPVADIPIPPRTAFLGRVRKSLEAWIAQIVKEE